MSKTTEVTTGALVELTLVTTVAFNADGSYSFGVELPNFPEDSEDRYVGGLSEGVSLESDGPEAGLDSMIDSLEMLLREEIIKRFQYNRWAEIYGVAFEWRNSTTGEPAFG